MLEMWFLSLVRIGQMTENIKKKKVKPNRLNIFAFHLKKYRIRYRAAAWWLPTTA